MTHQFTYNNGITQSKQLIRHSDYLKVKELPIDEQDAALDELTGGKEWFTDKSPYYDAIKTGVLNCNGIYLCKVVDLKKQSAYGLQLIDCNCNDCGFLKRDLNTFQKNLAEDKVDQQILFDNKKARAIEKALKKKEQGNKNWEQSLRAANALTHTYFPQSTPQCYGHCSKLDKPVTFIPNTLQLHTQSCFVHRKDMK
jgi:hypothetical protein